MQRSCRCSSDALIRWSHVLVPVTILQSITAAQQGWTSYAGECRTESAPVIHHIFCRYTAINAGLCCHYFFEIYCYFWFTADPHCWLRYWYIDIVVVVELCGWQTPVTLAHIDHSSLVPEWFFIMPTGTETRHARGDPSVRLPTFSGDDKDDQFVTWQFDVQCYQREGRTENELLSAIPRSVKGVAARTLVNLGIEASVSQILDKFKQVFSTIQSLQAVLHQFYSLWQQQDEDARAFAGRLEDALFQAVRLEAVPRDTAKAML